MGNLARTILILIFASCNFLGQTKIDSNFVGTIPSESLLLWLDSSHQTSLTPTGVGQELQYWKNLANQQNPITCSATYPNINEHFLNDLTTIEFHSTASNCIESSIDVPNSDYTVIGMVRPGDILGNYILIQTSGNSIFRINTTLNNLNWWDGAASQQSPGDVTITNRPMVVTLILKDPDLFFYLDGEIIHTGLGLYTQNGITAGNIFIGSTDLGYLGELFLYNRALSLQERHFLENYLMEKWDI